MRGYIPSIGLSISFLYTKTARNLIAPNANTTTFIAIILSIWIEPVSNTGPDVTLRTTPDTPGVIMGLFHILKL